uniref:ABC transporter domain-containing protein n=1 Tax=Fibrocapsa japonica TaxID=94617 RepID=A0A7S2XZ84_9STRA
MAKGENIGTLLSSNSTMLPEEAIQAQVDAEADAVVEETRLQQREGDLLTDTVKNLVMTTVAAGSFPRSESQPAEQKNGVQVHIVPGANLEVMDLSVFTPDGKRELLKDLDLTIGEGDRMLIVGESGAGKSSLLRTLAGLWTSGTGEVVRPPSSEMFFLPQRPYCPPGPLADQLTYPQRAEGVPEDRLLELLEQVGLGSLAVRMAGPSMDPAKGLEAVRDWADILSLGEQQRLGFARLLFNRPRVAVLDEATSALDLTNERRMYTLIQEHLSDSLSYVSVGHRPSLMDFHDSKLILSASSESRLEQICTSSINTSVGTLDKSSVVTRK